MPFRSSRIFLSHLLSSLLTSSFIFAGALLSVVFSGTFHDFTEAPDILVLALLGLLLGSSLFDLFILLFARTGTARPRV
jgi:hypothetical protein